MKKIGLLLIISVLSFINLNGVNAQSVLKSGFSPQEYKEVLSINSNHFDTLLGKHPLPAPASTRIFRSQEQGFDSKWDYWKTNSNIGVISIRGTAPTKLSWLENFYAAMIPATGKIIISDSTEFNYKLAKDSKAYVHAGWVFGLSFMAEDINKLMHKEYENGVSNFIIVGHSQGGVLAIMLRSYLEYVSNSLGNKIIIKTYASAPPKPGNLYYAYDFEEITQGGWAFRVVNTADWVPEMPLSVQRISDLNPVNPLAQIDKLIAKEPWYSRYYVNKTINNLDNKSSKLQSRYTKLFGDKSFKYVSTAFPEAESPTYAESFNYTVCGNAIILRPTDEYRINYVEKSDYSIFVNHHFYAYWFLINSQYPDRG